MAEWPPQSYDYFGQPVAQPAPQPNPYAAPTGYDAPAGYGTPPVYAAPVTTMPQPPPAGAGWPAGGEVWDGTGLPPWERPQPSQQPGGPPFPLGRGRMGFFEGLQTGWQLAATCGRVLAQDKFLVLVPMLAIAVSIAIAVPYIGFVGGLERFVEGGQIAFAIRAFPLAVALHIVGVFSSAAVIAAATVRLQGGTPRLDSAWAKALTHAPMLLVYGFISAIQRTLTGLLRSNRLGELVANVLDRGWDIATFLAIPVMLFEPGTGAVASVKRSASLVRKRIGTQVTGHATIGFAVLVIGLPIIVAAYFAGSVLHPYVGVGLAVLAYLGVSAVSAALTGIFSAAMYRFIVTGEVAPGFRQADMWGAFRRR